MGKVSRIWRRLGLSWQLTGGCLVEWLAWRFIWATHSPHWHATYPKQKLFGGIDGDWDWCADCLKFYPRGK